MKLLNITILEISKFLLLFNLFILPVRGYSQASDRFLFKVVDKTISVRDLHFYLRNFQALDCAYPGSITFDYFGKDFIKNWQSFLKGLPQQSKEISRYLYDQEEFLKKLRLFFKLVRYSGDQRAEITPELNALMIEAMKVNKCSQDIFYKDRLKTSFYNVLKVELYLKSRYGSQLNDSQNASSVKSSIDLFMESLDKQFHHEFYR